MSTAVAAVRRHRTASLVVAAVLVSVAVLSVLGVRDAVRGGALDPDNPGEDGARAVARVLRHEGVRVTVVRRATAFARASLDRDTTVLVTSTELLGDRTARAAAEHSDDAGSVVLAAPGPTVVRTWRLPLRPATVEDAAPADCDDPLVDGLSVDVGVARGYRPTRGAPAVACFRGAGREPGALLTRVDRGVPTYAVGGTALLTNDAVDRADNAAVALRLLGQHDRLVWYVPDSRDVSAGDAGSLRAQLPAWLVPGLWLVAAAVLATMLWRGRRLGPLVVEPLPVVVRAIEATRGRGRLYRRVRDRTHVAGVLRAATRRRLVALLRLPPGTSPDALVVALAHATGRDSAGLHDLLVSRPVPDDRTLTQLADDLAALEKEVAHP